LPPPKIAVFTKAGAPKFQPQRPAASGAQLTVPPAPETAENTRTAAEAVDSTPEVRNPFEMSS